MLREVIIFAVGASAGFAGGMFFFKTKYERIANEEIESMREYVKNKTGDDEKKDDSEPREKVVEEFNTHVVNYNTITESDKGVKKLNGGKPYRISEEDFVVDDEDFTKVSLEYYPESELLCEGNDSVNIDETVGRDILNLLHGFSDEVIYVRNEEFGIDYEIVKVPGDGPESERYV